MFERGWIISIMVMGYDSDVMGYDSDVMGYDR